MQKTTVQKTNSRRGPVRGPWLAVAIVLGLALAAPAHAEDLVPDVVGLDGARAKSLIEQAGYTVVAMYNSKKPAGRVFSQKPGGLAARTKGTLVQIFVGGEDPATATAPTPVAPPAPVSPPTPVAPPTPPPTRDPLPTPDPVPGTPPSPIDLGAPPTGLDGNQPPGPTPVPQPATPRSVPTPLRPGVRMEMIPPARLPSTNGPEIPSVLGRPLAEARKALGQWRVVVMRSLSVPSLEGNVINQWPFPGGRFAAGEGVVVVVAITSAGDADVRNVPDVSGRSPADARRAIESAGLAANLRTVPSEPTDYGRVVGQLPMADCLVAPGTSIRVWIGRGQGDEPVPAPIAAPPGVAPSPPVDLPPPAQPDTLPPMPDVRPPTQPTPVVPVAPPTPDPMAPPTADPVPPRSTLGATTLTSPPANESYPRAFGATFSWTKVSGATSYDWELEEEQPTGDWKQSESRSFTEARYRPDRMKKGRFRWRTRARSGNDVGPWSGWLRLYMY